jgi:uncharacterized membrane protein
MRHDFEISQRSTRWRALGGGALVLLAGALAYRRLGRAARRRRARSSVLDSSQAVQVRRSVTIRATPEELYGLWRKLDNLPRFMRHLEQVTERTATESHWVAKGPVGQRLEWDATIVQDTPNERIAWKSDERTIAGMSMAHAGSVAFAAVPGDRGTEVRVELAYEAPAGPLSRAMAKLFRSDPDSEVREDLRMFKESVEAGEIATSDRRPEGGV